MIIIILLPGPSVNFHMDIKVSMLIESLSTINAYVRPLSSVSSHVPVMASFMIETFSTL